MTRPAIGVAGLGSMGFGIAGSLVRAGFTTYGFDINPQQVRRLEQLGGQGGALTAMAPSLPNFFSIGSSTRCIIASNRSALSLKCQ